MIANKMSAGLINKTMVLSVTYQVSNMWSSCLNRSYDIFFYSVFKLTNTR